MYNLCWYNFIFATKTVNIETSALPTVYCFKTFEGYCIFMV